MAEWNFLRCGKVGRDNGNFIEITSGNAAVSRTDFPPGAAHSTRRRPVSGGSKDATKASIVASPPGPRFWLLPLPSPDLRPREHGPARKSHGSLLSFQQVQPVREAVGWKQCEESRSRQDRPRHSDIGSGAQHRAAARATIKGFERIRFGDPRIGHLQRARVCDDSGERRRGAGLQATEIDSFPPSRVCWTYAFRSPALVPSADGTVASISRGPIAKSVARSSAPMSSRNAREWKDVALLRQAVAPNHAEPE
jgi:hypothetical protein